MNTQQYICSFLLAFALCWLMQSPARAQFFQQGNKLVGTGAVGAAFQGYSVSLSADGNTAIVGGRRDNSFAGAAWVYTRSGGVWAQQGSKLVGTGAVGASFQGASVSISSDGNTAIVGGYGDNSNAGAAWVYTRSGGVWTQQGSKLVGTGAVGAALQGYSVSLSADGNTAIVGGVSDKADTGAAWVYTRSGGVWTQQGSKLVGTGAVGDALQGASVSISADGNTAIVGGYLDNSSAGAVWVYTRSGGVWTQQGSKLVGTGAVGAAEQGYSVSISADGNTAIVGGDEDNSDSGAVWVYTRSGGVWTQQGSKVVGTGAVGFARQGASVSLSADGNMAIWGGDIDNSSAGAAWVYQRAIPTIFSISDISHDQGGSVRIRWNKLFLDAAGISPQTTSYGIWRKVPPALSAAYKWLAPPQGMSLLDDSLSQYDYVMTVNAVQIPSYSVVVPTLEDSSASGTPYFTFLITAHTADPNIYFVSKSGSGYSVDNLAPIPPAGLMATIQSGPQVELNWNSPSDQDVKSYVIYRSTTSGFTPAPGNSIGTSGSTSFTDASPVSGVPSYYRIIALDVHDNQSLPSPQASAEVTNTVLYNVNDKWNMVSIPLTLSDYTKTILYPTAASNAFSYEGSYVIKTTLANGIGYWTKFSVAQSIPLTGLQRNSETITVSEGWNLIGSISTAINVASVASNPPGIVTSQFFGYTGSYVSSSTIEPGQAYWVKVTQTGELMLSSTSAATSSRIKIVAMSEMPPPPPDEGINSNNQIIPSVFSLGQNYPNPFNPTTVIQYELPVDGYVSLKVFNLLGQEVATLAEEVQNAGYKSVVWNASKIASGMYYYHLSAGSFSEVKKMLLMK